MVRSALGQDRELAEGLGMRRDLTSVPVFLDLTDEAAVLAEDLADSDPQTVRTRLASLNLCTTLPLRPHAGESVDAAVLRATGDRRLAAIFA